MSDKILPAVIGAVACFIVAALVFFFYQKPALDLTRHQPIMPTVSYTQRSAASAVSSGRVLKAIAEPGAPL